MEKKEQLIGEIQKKYGYIKSQAEEEFANWEKSCGSCSCGTDHGNHYNQGEMHVEDRQEGNMNSQQRKAKHRH